MSYNLKENVMKEDRLSGGPFSSFFPKAFPLRGRWPEGPDEVAIKGKPS